MGLNVRIAPRAGRDLEEIRSYLAERSPKGAERVRKHIDAVLERLAVMPLMGAATSEKNVRVVQLVTYPYRIFYVVRDDAIDVVHVRHTSRRPFTPSDI